LYVLSKILKGKRRRARNRYVVVCTSATSTFAISACLPLMVWFQCQYMVRC